MTSSWHDKLVAEVLQAFEVDPGQGLTDEAAAAQLAEHGPNVLTREESTSALAIFAGQFKNVLILILIAAIVLSALVGEFEDAVIIGIIVVFAAVLGFVQEYRAERALEALRGMLAPMVAVLRSGREMEVPSAEVVPGDVLLLAAGSKVPADARVIEAHALRADEAALTGESQPVGKDEAPLPAGTRSSDRGNMVFAGTSMTYGRGRALVVATGMDTEFGRIAREVAVTVKEKTPLERRTDEIGKWLGLAALLICALVAGISIAREAAAGQLTAQFAVTVVMFSVALAVAAVPEALAAIVTGALAIGMRHMARSGALVRRMPAVETLGCTTVICTDKTGTLTRGEMTVRRMFAAGRTVEVSGAGYAPEGKFTEAGGEAAEADGALAALLTAGVLCNDAELFEKEGQWRIGGDPTEAALVVAGAKAGLWKKELMEKSPRTEELPFSSERKRMTTIHGVDGGRLAYVKGAPEVVLSRCDTVLTEAGVKPLDEGQRREIARLAEAMAGDALRVLAAARRELPAGLDPADEAAVEAGLTFLGLWGMMDPPRPEAVEAIRTCRRVHITPVMITGDHRLTAMAIAREMGIYREGDRVLTGEELEAMDEAALAEVVRTVSVYARVSPIDKLKIVKAWKALGEVVAMTGDGVNDAPALKHADIGVAMGISGTEVTKEAADMVLTDDNFATIVVAIERGRWIYDNIKKYLTYLLRCNITEVVVIGGVVLAMGPDYLPLLPAAILYINLATDGLPALALGISPPDPDIMQRPPRDPREPVFTTDVRAFLLTGLVIEIPFFLFLFFHDLADIIVARTEIFFAFIVVEIVVALNFRSLRYSVLAAPPHLWLVLAIVWEVVLLVGLIQIPALREAFGITWPTAPGLAIILGYSALIFLAMEGLKGFLRRRDRGRIKSMKA